MVGISFDVLIWNVLLFQDSLNTLDCVGLVENTSNSIYTRNHTKWTKSSGVQFQ